MQPNRQTSNCGMSGRRSPNSMHRVFVAPAQIVDGQAFLSGSDHRHIARVLRAQPGDEIVVLDGRGNAYRAFLVSIGKSETAARLAGSIEPPPEPQVAITVGQALGKADKFEQVVQHGVEAGACAFVALRARRCVADLPAGRAADRLARWGQIAKGAAEQSGRAYVPTVSGPLRLDAWMAQAQESGWPGILLHPGLESVPLHAALERLGEPPERLLLAVGPEGGWDPTEVSAARAANLTAVTLGPRILRTETAALVAISQILYHFGGVWRPSHRE